MKSKLRFGLSQVNNYAPRWLINATSLVAIAIAAKHHLINGLPLLSEPGKQLAMQWTDYLLDSVQVLLAIGVIFFGEHKSEQYDTTGN